MVGIAILATLLKGGGIETAVNATSLEEPNAASIAPPNQTSEIRNEQVAEPNEKSVSSAVKADDAQQQSTHPPKKLGEHNTQEDSKLPRCCCNSPSSSNRDTTQFINNIISGVMPLPVTGLCDPIVFSYVAPGEFRFGMTDEQRRVLVQGTNNVLEGHNAQPSVPVKIARGFFLARREISVAQWKAFQSRGDEKKSPPDSGDMNSSTEPIGSIQWDEAVQFCDWLSKETGHSVRLPYEIEWEYAASGHGGRLFPWGDDAPQSLAPSEQRPMEIESFPQDISWSQVLGLGTRVSEWCQDRYIQDLHVTLGKSKELPIIHDPYSPALGKAVLNSKQQDRVFRGGSVRDLPHRRANSIRRSLGQYEKSPFVGFRPVLLLTLPTETITETSK